MNIHEFKAIIQLIPFDQLVTTVKVNNNLRGQGIETSIHERLEALGRKHFRIPMAQQDPFFFQEFVAMAEYHEKSPTTFVLDFMNGCDKELKEHLLQLIYNRQHNGFKLPDTARTILIFGEEQKSGEIYTNPKIDDYWILHGFNVTVE